jgi:hypothetical protein
LLDVEKIRGAVTIYRHRKSGAFEVQPMCRRGRFALADAGPAVRVAAENDEALASSVLQALDSFATSTFDTSGPRLSAKDQSKFVREHDSIMAVRLDERLEITPWTHAEGGFASNDATAETLRDPVTAADLVRAIREAFDRAG